MKAMRTSVSVALAVAALLALASPALAQKGKGFGRGGIVPPFGPGRPGPVRPFEHPNMGNSLPQSTLDRLPPGLRDKPINQPGLANHLSKLALDQQAARWLAQPQSGNSLMQGIRDGLPLGPGNVPINQPGLANQLRQLILPSTMTPFASPGLPGLFQP
jgi:hypothetical protein